MSRVASVADDRSSEELLGVSLARYAGIQAALALGFPLRDVLANERLSGKKWERCRAAWAGRLAREGHGSALSSAFQDKLAEATRWLGRTVTPLEEDLSAWIGFLGAYAAEESPSALLDRLGLRGDDVQRLVRAWKRRTDGDESLAKKARDLLAKDLRIVPAVQVGAARLRPFPWSPGPEQAPRSEPVLRAPPAPPVTEAEAPRLPTPIETPSFLLEPRTPFVPVPEAPPAAPPPSPGIGETVVAFTLAPSASALPFASSAEKAPSIAAEPGAPVKQSGETIGVFELPRSALPFPETGTLLTLETPVPRELPFEGRAVASPPGERSSQTAGDSTAARPVPSLSTGTILAPEPAAGSSGAALPFREGSSGPMGDRVGGVDLSALVRAVQARGPDRAPRESAAQRPEVASAPRSEPTAKPALTLEQHASLCAELAFAPHRTAEVLSRYGVTADAKRSLDAFYAGATEQKAGWEAAYRTYYAWLASAGSRRT